MEIGCMLLVLYSICVPLWSSALNLHLYMGSVSDGDT